MNIHIHAYVYMYVYTYMYVYMYIHGAKLTEREEERERERERETQRYTNTDMSLEWCRLQDERFSSQYAAMRLANRPRFDGAVAWSCNVDPDWGVVVEALKAPHLKGGRVPFRVVWGLFWVDLGQLFV